METRDLSRAEWRTSSYSGSNGNCIEVVAASRARVLVRDTKDREGPVLVIRQGEWRLFTQQLKVRPLSKMSRL